MPWINAEMCTACGVCVENCPVDAITMTDAVAEIRDEDCIRCGTCHEVCPENAVRHDSERIPDEVKANVEWARGLLNHYEIADEKRGTLGRLVKYFNKQKKVAEQTMSALEGLELEP